MMLICPTKMFKICGISSRLVFLRTLPTLVMYWSGFPRRWVGTSCGVDVFIVLNFRMLKSFLCIPTFFCVKNTGPGLSITIARTSNTQIGRNTTIPMNESTMSMSRLKKCLYIIFSLLSLLDTRQDPSRRRS